MTTLHAAAGRVDDPIPRSRRAATQPYKPTRTTTRLPLCFGVMPCRARFVIDAVAGIPRWHARGQGGACLLEPPSISGALCPMRARSLDKRPRAGSEAAGEHADAPR